MTSRPGWPSGDGAVTSPMAVAQTPHFSAVLSTASSLSGATSSSIRSWDSLARISCGSIEGSRSGTRSSHTRMPVPAAAAVSVSAQVSPAPPRSWMPTTSSASYSSRHASISSFSMNGSPTWTDGRRCSLPSSKVALASTDTPPMPSRPVLAPISTTTLPGPAASFFCSRSTGSTPRQSALTNGLPW